MKWNYPIYTAAFLLLTGCNSFIPTSQDETNEFEQLKQPFTEQSSESMVLNEFGTETQQDASPEEVIRETENELNTGVPVKLPASINVTPDYHLTAMTTSEQKHYEVMFYETEQSIPINDEKLNNMDFSTVKFKATRYESPEEAAKQIDHQLYSENGAQSADLGFGIKGYRDAGAGSQFMGWNEGRWSLSLRSTTQQGEKIVGESKKIVQFLEENTLPIPHELGAVKVDVSDAGGKPIQHIAWQEDAIVYEIQTRKSMLDALQIAVSIHEKDLNND